MLPSEARFLGSSTQLVLFVLPALCVCVPPFFIFYFMDTPGVGGRRRVMFMLVPSAAICARPLGPTRPSARPPLPGFLGQRLRVLTKQRGVGDRCLRSILSRCSNSACHFHFLNFFVVRKALIDALFSNEQNKKSVRLSVGRFVCNPLRAFLFLARVKIGA